MARRLRTALLAAGALAPLSIEAQVVHGRLTTAAGEPASGTIVELLLGARDSVVARTVANDRGFYRLLAPGQNRVRVRALRLGQRPTTSDVIDLAAGGERRFDLALPHAPIVLAAVTVRDRTTCVARPDSNGLLGQLLEETRKALLASATMVTGSSSVAEIALFTRTVDLAGNAVAPMQMTRITGPSFKPFASLSPDSLARIGYVTEEADGTVYRAPDADVLLSDAFARTHCLRLLPEGDPSHRASSARAAPDSVGIAFTPTERRRGRIDIAGTIWLDRATATLRAVDFRYEPLPSEQRRLDLGGRVEFVPLAAGHWIAHRWELRMPRVAYRQLDGYQNVRAREAPRTLVAEGLQITGGVVERVRADGDVLYTGARIVDDGGVASGAGDVSPTSAKVGAVVHADSFAVVSSCAAPPSTAADDAAVEPTGQVSGRLVSGANRTGVAGAVVTAEWREQFRAIGSAEWRYQVRHLTTPTGTRGTFTLCGVPRARPVVLTAVAAGSRSRPITVRLTDASPSTNVDLVIAQEGVATTATMGAGTTRPGVRVRVEDPAGAPVPHALVVANGGTPRVGNDAGDAVISATGDSVRLLVRRVGIAPADSTFAVPRDGGPVVVRLHPPLAASGAQLLRTVRVEADRGSDPLDRTGFYRRVQTVANGAVLGDFLTPEQVELRRGATVSQLIQGSRYARVWTGTAAKGGRARSVIVGRSGCPMTIIIDGQRMNNVLTNVRDDDERGMKLAIDELVDGPSVLAVEIYPSTANAPAELIPLTGNGSCGIVAVWTGGR